MVLFIVQHCVFDMTSAIKDTFRNGHVYYLSISFGGKNALLRFSVKPGHVKIIFLTGGVLQMINASSSSLERQA